MLGVDIRRKAGADTAVEMNSLQKSNREKQLVALRSVAAAMLLTAMKAVVGLMTGSLGLLSEAAHSALDLVAAGVTFLAVRVSDRPPDRDHTYGHGKVENLSALFEAVLLLATCAWIVYEAIQRLFFKHVVVEVSVWAFLVMGLSIVIDVSRSRALARAAKKYDSQALEADALHFSTDVWSSSVVIVGLVLVSVAGWINLPWLAKADAVAALGVAALIIYVSVQLGRRSAAALLDAVPIGTQDTVVQAVSRVPGVLEVKQVRLRRSGPEAFADVTATIGRDVALEQADAIATQVEEAVHGVFSGADVMVHMDPVRSQEERMVTTVRLVAAHQGLTAHSVHLYDVADGSSPDSRLGLELHLEVADSLRVDEAHRQAAAFEKALREALPEVAHVVTHIEPVADGDTSTSSQASAADKSQVMGVLQEWLAESAAGCRPHQVMVRRWGDELSVSLHCEMDGDTALVDAHVLTERIEQALRNRIPDLGRVVIHGEPDG